MTELSPEHQLIRDTYREKIRLLIAQGAVRGAEVILRIGGEDD